MTTAATSPGAGPATEKPGRSQPALELRRPGLTDVIHDRLPKDKVPWLSWGWFKSEYEDPWMFPCHANGMREASQTLTDG